MRRASPTWVAGGAVAMAYAVLLGVQAEAPPPGTVAASPGELQSYATIHSIGIEWNIAGDSDLDATCKVQYRPRGSRAWKEALPLFRIDFYGWYADTKADRPYNMLALIRAACSNRSGGRFGSRGTGADPQGSQARLA